MSKQDLNVITTWGRWKELCEGLLMVVGLSGNRAEFQKQRGSFFAKDLEELGTVWIYNIKYPSAENVQFGGGTPAFVTQKKRNVPSLANYTQVHTE